MVINPHEREHLSISVTRYVSHPEHEGNGNSCFRNGAMWLQVRYNGCSNHCPSFTMHATVSQKNALGHISFPGQCSSVSSTRPITFPTYGPQWCRDDFDIIVTSFLFILHFLSLRWLAFRIIYNFYLLRKLDLSSKTS
jgi:hypothetical protein